MRCSDWVGADISIEDQYYEPFESGHHFHVQEPIHYSFSPRPTDLPQRRNWFGRVNPTEAKMEDQNGFPRYNFNMEIGNVSGKYFFEGKISKNFDGRTFSDTKKDLQLTDASLPWGGLFDRGGTGENWQGLHSRHRLGYNLDFSSALTDGMGLNRLQKRELNDIVRQKVGNNSFCIVEADGHIHCRFYANQ